MSLVSLVARRDPGQLGIAGGVRGLAPRQTTSPHREMRSCDPGSRHQPASLLASEMRTVRHAFRPHHLSLAGAGGWIPRLQGRETRSPKQKRCRDSPTKRSELDTAVRGADCDSTPPKGSVDMSPKMDDNTRKPPSQQDATSQGQLVVPQRNAFYWAARLPPVRWVLTSWTRLTGAH